MDDDNSEANPDNNVEFDLSGDNNRSSLYSTLSGGWDGMDISPFKLHAIPKLSQMEGRKLNKLKVNCY